MSRRITDPTPSLQRLMKEYFFWNDGENPYLLTCTSSIYRLTKLQTFLVKIHLLSVKSIDRYQTRLARFNSVKNRVINKVKRKGCIDPFLYNHPKTGKPILFTSIGVVYELSYFDRLMLKIGKVTINDIDEKAIGWHIFYSSKDDSYRFFNTGYLDGSNYEEYYQK
jgi:hypothetical protein